MKKALAFPLLVISIKSPNGTYDSAFLSNYTTININDAIARIQGVGQINLFGGSDYAMRVWLRPDVIGRLGHHVPDIANAISPAEPVEPGRPDRRAARAAGTEFTYTVRTQGRLLNEEEFGNIIVRTNPDGSRGPPQGRRPLELGTMLYNAGRPPRRHAVGRHRRVPDSRHQRARRGQPDQGDDGGPVAALPARHGLRSSRSTRRCRSSRASTRSSTRCSRRWRSSSSSSSSSCRTGGPR